MRKKIFTFLLALVTSVGLSWATDPIVISTNTGQSSYTQGDITITCSKPGTDSDGFYLQESGNETATITNSGSSTISQIELEIGWFPQNRTYVRANGAESTSSDQYSITFTNVNSNNVTLTITNEKIQIRRVTITLADEGGSTPTPSGDKLPGVFSVSADKAVCFSKGNLQYTKSTGKWSFMEHQYDVVEAYEQNVGNDYADQDVVGLFGWGTSGNSESGTNYQPYCTSTTNVDYVSYLTVAGEWTASKSDWGVVNSGDLGEGWRVMTKDEWCYLLGSTSAKRDNASNLRTFATVNGMKGLILMPDGWTASSVSLTVTTSNFTTNNINATDWATLEEQGCVFLPAAGYRSGSSVSDVVGNEGHYWYSTAQSSTRAYKLSFSSDGLSSINYYQRNFGLSVRLVSETAPTPTEVVLTAHSDPDHTSDYYTTFFDSSAKYALPSGVEAFIVTAVSGEVMQLKKIAVAGQTIPAAAGVILKATSDQITLTPSDEDAVSAEGNRLLGVDDATPVTDVIAAGHICYVLSGHSTDDSVTGLGFYIYEGANITAHKAYIDWAGGPNNAPRRLIFHTDEEQGIEDVQNAVQSTKLIENGQLVIIKNGIRYNAQGQIVK